MTRQEARAERKAAWERIQLLKKLVAFVESIIDERGEEVLLKINSTFVHSISKRQNYASFSFYFNAYRNKKVPYEIKEVRIWYHPVAKYKRSLPPVLHVRWHSPLDDYVCLKFHESRFWQQAIRKVIQCRKGISRRIDRRAAAAVRRLQLKRSEAEKRERRTYLQREGRRRARQQRMASAALFL